MEFYKKTLELIEEIMNLEMGVAENPRTRSFIMYTAAGKPEQLTQLGEFFVILSLLDQRDKAQVAYNKNRERIVQERLDQEHAKYQE